MLRRASRLWITTASSSPVDWRSVEKRQCSTSSCPSKAPTCVWVLPTSIVSSTAGKLFLRVDGGDPGHALALSEGVERLGQRAAARQRQMRGDLEQRNEHEAPTRDARVGDDQIFLVDA